MRFFGWSRKPHRKNRLRRKQNAQATNGRPRIRRVLRSILGITGIIVLVGGVYWGSMQVFKWAMAWTAVEHVSVLGLARVPHEEVLATLNLPSNISLLSISTEELINRLQTHPWIASVEMDRVFPHSLVVRVVEREPAAVLRASQESLLLDASGFVLPGGVPVEAKRLPVVEGLTPQSVVEHGREGHPRVKLGIGIARLLTPYFPGRAQINVSEPLKMVVDLPQVRFQLGQNAEEQLQRFLVLYPTIKGEIDGRSQEVDLRFSQKVILRKRTM
jgi:cell division septal protein FtsQ